MKDFMIKVKGYYDSLASCGKVISEHAHVTAILNGFSLKYESVITVIIASQLPSSVQTITIMFFNVEARMQSTVVEIPSSAIMITHQQIASVVDNNSIPTYRPTLSSSRG
ncbi:hypothetical protein PVK06_003968 [Gossypium arboreum]|uniref:Uncharacterized protein n=1 Tax=Gossypium arboreum TaxID=29729 RepID=A0ABR0QQQ9_GOSAR|nr:hypothetical protein PVK06_003968 [Gossypium arboreum]